MRADPGINICFSTTDGFSSRAIRWVTRSTVSHALITYRSATLGRVMVLEAVGRGFHMVPWAHWKQHNTLVARFSLKVAPSRQVQALHTLTDSLGQQYDSLSLLGFLLRRWRKRARNPFDNATKLICSEVVARLLQSVSLKGFDDAGQWTPEDLLQEALARPHEFELIEGERDGLRAARTGQ